MADLQNPFDVDDSDEGDEDTAPSGKAVEETSTIRQIRTQYRKLEKQLKEVLPELETLRTEKAERAKQEREVGTGKVFTDLNLDPRHSKLFLALNPEGDVTPQAVAKFATEYGLGVAEDVEEATDARKDKSGFTPIATGETPSAKTYTLAEYLELAKTDPTLAAKIKKQKRVKFEQAPWDTGID